MTLARVLSAQADLRRQVKLRSSGRSQKLPLLYAGLTR
jgi:hypothetical protein